MIRAALEMIFLFFLSCSAYGQDPLLLSDEADPSLITHDKVQFVIMADGQDKDPSYNFLFGKGNNDLEIKIEALLCSTGIPTCDLIQEFEFSMDVPSVQPVILALNKSRMNSILSLYGEDAQRNDFRVFLSIKENSGVVLSELLPETELLEPNYPLEVYYIDYFTALKPLNVEISL